MEKLKNIIICPHCESVIEKKELNKKEVAFCPVCNKKLYESTNCVKYRLFNFSIAMFIFYILSMLLPIIRINIIGYEENLEIINSFIFLFSKGYVFLSLFVFFSVILFPFICIVILFMLSLLFISGFDKKLAKNLLVIITVLKDWCFVDIFLIAILVSVIKLFNVAEIDFSIGFWPYMLFLSFLVYIVKFLKVESLWEIWGDM